MWTEATRSPSCAGCGPIVGPLSCGTRCRPGRPLCTSREPEVRSVLRARHSAPRLRRNSRSDARPRTGAFRMTDRRRSAPSPTPCLPLSRRSAQVACSCKRVRAATPGARRGRSPRGGGFGAGQAAYASPGFCTRAAGLAFGDEPVCSMEACERPCLLRGGERWHLRSSERRSWTTGHESWRRVERAPGRPLPIVAP